MSISVPMHHVTLSQGDALLIVDVQKDFLPGGTPIRGEEEYDHAVLVLNELLDAGGANENHPLAKLVTLLGHFISDYERTDYPLDEGP